MDQPNRSELTTTDGALCNNTSVGIIVQRDERLLLIERRKPPFGWAPPAGHVDVGETFAAAAERELCEEVGLRALSLRLVLSGRYRNRCRRPGGDHHDWQVFEAVCDPDQQPRRSKDETCAMRWVTNTELEYLRRVTLAHLVAGTSSVGWQQRPGLEPVWLEMFNTLDQRSR